MSDRIRRLVVGGDAGGGVGRDGGFGYAAGGWPMPSVEISGSPAEAVLQTFFVGRQSWYGFPCV